MPKKIVVAAVVTLALVATGAAAASHYSVATARSAAATKSATRITLHATKLGKVLSTSAGMTLYMYKPDTKNHSNCYTGCANFWPPLTSKTKASAGAGVKAKLLGLAMRKNGQHQVTYNGHPLYRYSGDKKAGQTNGEGFDGIWFALNASGGKAAKSGGGGATSTNPGTTTNPTGY